MLTPPGFPLRCFQRLSLPNLATRRAAGATTGTPEVRPTRSSRTKVSSLKFLTPTEDRDRTVSRRSEPSSRTALIDEQSNPWDLLQPQDAMSRHRGAKRVVDVNSWTRSACYPRSTFYPLSDGPSTRNHRITNTCFRTCSTCMSCSQAPLCVYTLRLVSIQAEGTFVRLRYSLGGDRPSQTAHQTLSPGRITGPAG
jgi:hypothetical protein